MAWTTPRTWAVGDPLTAADMNTYVRDNSLAAKPLVTPWTNVSSFSNGWTAGSEPPRCCIDGAGNVHFEGGANPGTLTDGTVLCTVPAAFYPGAPASGIAYPVTSNAVSSTQSPRVTITSAGQVAVKGLASGATFINFWIIYRAD